MTASAGRPIFLVGYMCSGKTTLGRALSRRLRSEFIDLDDEIERSTGRTINRIFREDGEATFRRLETEALDAVIDRYGNSQAVVAVGGGTPCHGSNMERMKNAGMTVCLVTTVDRLVERLEAGRANRPLVAGKSADELRRFVIDSLIDRSPHYDRAAAVFDSTQLETPECIAASADRFINVFGLKV